jgi:hypothetical protein
MTLAIVGVAGTGHRAGDDRPRRPQGAATNEADHNGTRNPPQFRRQMDRRDIEYSVASRYMTLTVSD